MSNYCELVHSLYRLAWSLARDLYRNTLAATIILLTSGCAFLLWRLRLLLFAGGWWVCFSSDTQVVVVPNGSCGDDEWLPRPQFNFPFSSPHWHWLNLGTDRLPSHHQVLSLLVICSGTSCVQYRFNWSRTGHTKINGDNIDLILSIMEKEIKLWTNNSIQKHFVSWAFPQKIRVTKKSQI